MFVCLLSKMDDIKIYYKYQPINQKVLENLKKGQLYFSHPTTFNDPFDSKINYYHKGKKEQWFNLFKNNNKSQAEAEEYLKFNISRGWYTQEGFYIIFDPKNDDYRSQNERLLHGDFHIAGLPLIACFSEVNNNILMWSHYANNHKGICLCFSSKKESDYYTMVLNSNKYLHPEFVKVKYQNSLPDRYNMFDLERDKHIVQHLTTKFSDWQYEHEWRIILTTDRFKKNNLDKSDDYVSGGKINYNKNDLESIIFGLRISGDDAESVCKIVREEYLEKDIKVKLYKTKEIQGEYALQIEQINDINAYLISLSQ